MLLRGMVKPLTAISMAIVSLLSTTGVAECPNPLTAPSPMLHPAAAPESWASDLVPCTLKSPTFTLWNATLTQYFVFGFSVAFGGARKTWLPVPMAGGLVRS